MKFNEKLIILMETTNTSNKQLADGINVDPSMISLIRTGRRGKPRNADHIKAMADYFASRCRTTYQREVISETIGQYNLRYQSNYSNISSVFFDWLSNDSYTVPDILSPHLDFLKPPKESAVPDTVSHQPLLPALTTVYFGTAGKTQAYDYLFHFLSETDFVCDTIYLTTDESDNWFPENLSRTEGIKDDASFWHSVEKKHHCSYSMILPPITSPIFLDLLSNWFILYIRDPIEVFFYPYNRDPIYRRAMVIVPGQIALISNSVYGDLESPYTILTRDPQLIQANLSIFHSYLSKCRRVLKVYENSIDIHNCFMKYGSIETSFFQLSASLSVSSLPRESLHEFFPKLTDPDPSSREDSLFMDRRQAFLSFYDTFYRSITEHIAIDVCPLASVDDILTGKVYPYDPISQEPGSKYYTPESYQLHLKNILLLMKSFPNYYFVPIPYHNKSDYSMLFKENAYGMIIHHQSPIRVMSVEQLQFIQPFQSYILKFAELGHYSGAGKRRIIHQLQDLIEELDQVIASHKSGE